MGSIRVSRLSSDFLEDTVKPFLKASDRSLSCLSDLDDTDKNADSDGTVIIAMGYESQVNDQEENNNIELRVFDFKNGKWIPLVQNVKISRRNCKVDCCNIVSIENYVALYCTEDTSKAIVYNFKTGKISDSKVNIPKHNKLVALEGRVYAVGLMHHDLSVKVLREGRWRIGASMSRERLAANVVAHDGKIYVFGGMEMHDRATPTAEAYDPVKDEWESIPPMLTARFAQQVCGSGAASLGGNIYVVGGYGHNYETLATGDTGECYDPKTKMWTRISNMIDDRVHVGAVANNGALALFVVKYCCEIEKYIPKSNTWETVKTDNSDDFQIEALCTLSKKYLPKTLFNNNE